MKLYNASSGIDTVFTCPNCTMIGAGIKIHCVQHGGNIIMPPRKEPTVEITNEELAALAADTNVTSVDEVQVETLPEDGENLTTKVLYKIARAQGAVYGTARKIKPTKEGFFSKTEDVLTFGITNPITSVGVATVSTLTNPFKVNRKSPKQAYAEQRRYNTHMLELDVEVRECPNCDATYGIETQPHKAGQKGYLSQKTFTRDTFCDDHKKAVRKAQKIVCAAKGMYL